MKSTEYVENNNKILIKVFFFSLLQFGIMQISFYEKKIGKYRFKCLVCFSPLPLEMKVKLLPDKS